jgi:hypothetical protein
MWKIENEKLQANDRECAELREIMVLARRLSSCREFGGFKPLGRQMSNALARYDAAHEADNESSAHGPA